jgi:threonine dehydratase
MAYEKIDSIFRDTPQFVSPALKTATGKNVFLKIETVNPIRSFKGRGSCLLLKQFTKGQQVICPSAGNLGQALAYCARSAGIHLTVVSAKTANPLKVDAMRRLGAEVILEGEDFDAAKEYAEDLARSENAYLVSDGKDPFLIEGAGTIGLELLRSTEKLAAIYVPVGNGSLIVGIAAWVKAYSPSTKIIGVAPINAPAMARSFKEGRIIIEEKANTIAEGLAVRIPVPEAVSYMRQLVDDVILVTEESMLGAMQLAYKHLGLVLEPSGACGIAGVIASSQTTETKETIATILCGGNARMEHLASLFS